MLKRCDTWITSRVQGLCKKLRDRSPRDSKNAIEAFGSGEIDVLKKHLEVPFYPRWTLSVTDKCGRAGEERGY